MDPRVDPNPSNRKPVLSRLMLAILANKEGHVLNFCPFGCEDGDLDENGYCRHLVGFTNDKKTYEPMVKQRGVRVVQVERERVEIGRDSEGKVQYGEGAPKLPACQKGDKFEQISISWRVYRDVDAQKETSPPSKVEKKAS